jgi:hypothetical protein
VDVDRAACDQRARDQSAPSALAGAIHVDRLR